MTYILGSQMAILCFMVISVSLTCMPNLTKLEMARALTIGESNILTIGNCMKAQQLT